MSTVADRDEGTIACPRCAAPVEAGQDWCLACGDAARTRLVPTPNWQAPVVLLATVAILAGVALALAFVALTNDNEPPPPANSQAPPPSAATGAPQPTQSTPTAPPAATTAPGANAQPGSTTTPSTSTPATSTSTSTSTSTPPGATGTTTTAP
jgi:hypothetical protein